MKDDARKNQKNHDAGFPAFQSRALDAEARALTTESTATFLLAGISNLYWDIKSHDALRSMDQKGTLRRSFNLSSARHQSLHARPVPPALHAAYRAGILAGYPLWEQASRTGKIGLVLPAYKAQVSLAREIGDRRAEHIGLSSPFEAWLDHFNPGLTERRLAEVAAPVGSFTADFLPAALARQESRNKPRPLSAPFDDAARWDVMSYFMAHFHSDRTRLVPSITEQAKTFGSPERVYFSLGRSQSDPLASMLDIYHELFGHAAYRLNAPGIHSRVMDESLAILNESGIGKSPESISRLSVILDRRYGLSGPTWSAANLQAHADRLKPEAPRAYADALTYPLHALAQVNVARRMIDGLARPDDLPEVWQSEMLETAGVTVPRTACLQDFQTFAGRWGDMASYFLGHLGAYQLLDAMTAEEPAALPDLAKGRFRVSQGWQKERVHQWAGEGDFDAHFRHSTGQALTPGPWIAHMTAKYGGPA